MSVPVCFQCLAPATRFNRCSNPKCFYKMHDFPPDAQVVVARYLADQLKRLVRQFDETTDHEERVALGKAMMEHVEGNFGDVDQWNRAARAILTRASIDAGNSVFYYTHAVRMQASGETQYLNGLREWLRPRLWS